MARSVYLLICILLTFVACQNDFDQGQRIYEARCGNCHMSDGSGLGDAIPPLNKEKLERLGLDVTCTILNGRPGGETVAMPANKDLTEAELTNLLNYLRSNFINDGETYTPLQVRQSTEACN